MPAPLFNRRRALGLIGAGTGLSGILAHAQAPAVITLDAARPQLPSGVMSGDITHGRAVLWSRSDRPARLHIELATRESLQGALRLTGPAALEVSDHTAHLDLSGLAPGQTYFYRARFQDLDNPRVFSEGVTGRFRTPSLKARDVVFAFSGDEAGQGWGINEAFGGYRVYAAMRRFEPDFFIHSGDQIYADGPLQPEVLLDDGSLWRNLVTPAKRKVAETLDEFRGCFAYNLLDEHKRRFCAEVPMLVQWDDHEVRNNWYPEQQFGPEEKRYQQRSASLLAERARRAMFEYNPMRLDPADPERVYRSFRHGPLLDVFMLDERSYRGPNTPNRQTTLTEDAAFLGRPQLDWLKAALKASKATWKVIASDMPISLVVADLNADVPPGTYEAWANGDPGRPLGRELELAELLRFIKHQGIQNVVWVTADVHFAQATHYRPERARFTDFKPFWEFVGGPLNAGTFASPGLDMTFGPELKFVSVPPDLKPNRPPTERLQFFGIGRIDAKTRALTVSLHGLDGERLYSVEIPPEA